MASISTQKKKSSYHMKRLAKTSICFSRVSRICKSAIRLLQVLVLLLAVGGSSAQAGQSCIPSAAAKNDSPEKRVKEIQIKVKEIEAAREAPSTGNLHTMIKDLPHWQFSGLFEDKVPMLVTAAFAEGEVVRQESYYFVHGKLVQLRVEKWWDVDDARQAPEPTTRQDFYLGENCVFLRVIKVESRPPKTRSYHEGKSAEPLLERSHIISQILLTGSESPRIADSLRAFPYVDLPNQ